MLANLPYVRSAAVPGLPKAASYEPVIALDGGPDGLRVIDRLLAQLLPGPSRRGRRGLLEIGARPGGRRCGRVAESRLPGWSCEIELDLGRLPARRDPPPRQRA